MSFKDRPDPSVDWDSIQYSVASDVIRPEPGYRICKSCGVCYPVNNYHFAKYNRSPDGYQYVCKDCNKKYRKSKK